MSGLRALGDLRHLSRDVSSGDLAHALRTAMVRHHQRASLATESDHLAGVAIAVRIATAHLDAGNLAEARLALHGAHEALPHRDRLLADAHFDDGPVDHVGDALEIRARAALEAHRRHADTSVLLAQAVGLLAEHTGATPTHARTALRRHAGRHGFVLSELASDIVAGRVAPSAVLDPTGPTPNARRRRTT